MQTAIEKDCTHKCKSQSHARQLLRSALQLSPDQLQSYAVGLCNNFMTVCDELGRNLLHIAASCGKHNIIEWLLRQCNANADTKDWESGWTALHRSLFYGQLPAAKNLCMNEASLFVPDHDGLTPLDIIIKDRLPYIEYFPSDPSEVYVWGSNLNYNLGLGNSQVRTTPEALDFFRKQFINIQQVQICKFHSVFRTTEGRVFTCGHGHGGRLGHNSEDISLTPGAVKGFEQLVCLEAAIGQDHLLLLTNSGDVLSCGLNVYHQLGHFPPVERILSPRAISLKCLKGKPLAGIRAARFHSLLFTKNNLYTFGLNAGQLGHLKGERTQILPREVSGLQIENCHINHVETSDGAIICCSSQGDIFVIHEYRIRKIASRQLEVKKLSVVGGHLDHCCDVSSVREGGGTELRVALMTCSGKLYLWKETDPHLRRCLFSLPKELIIQDMHMNHSNICLIASTGEGYLGTFVTFKGDRGPLPAPVRHQLSNFSKQTHTGLVVLLNRKDCHLVKVKRLSNVFRATSITSDSKGLSFAVLQSSPLMGLVEIPVLTNSVPYNDIKNLFLETHGQDDLQDIVIKVDEKEFPAHKFILCSRSKFFCKELGKSDYLISTFAIQDIKSEIFAQIIQFIYSDHCDFLKQGYKIKWLTPKEKTSKLLSPVKLLQEASKKFGLNQLSNRLNSAKIVNGHIEIKEKCSQSKLIFKREFLPQLHDVNLISSDNVSFSCHKCILVARLDYFRSMLSSFWIENSKVEELPLPIPSRVLELLLNFLYCEDASKVIDSDDVEFIFHVLQISDQLLIPHLKEICEVSLMGLITLKNAAEFLELATLYNAEQLNKSCMQYICINLPTMVESNGLAVLSDDVMQSLGVYYRSLVPSMHKRKISFNNQSNVLDAESMGLHCPIDEEYVFQKTKSNISHGKSKRSRRRTNSVRSDKEKCLDVQCDSTKEIILEKIPLDLDEDFHKSKPIQNDSSKENSDIERKKNISNVIDPSEKPKISPILVPLTLAEIMHNEEKNLKVLDKKLRRSDMKPIPKVSQKQKKKNQQSELQSNSPSKESFCPWAKLSQQSPPSPTSPSFWEMAAARTRTSSQRSSISTPQSPPSVWSNFGETDSAVNKKSNVQSQLSPPSTSVWSSSAEKDSMINKNLSCSPDVSLNLHDIILAEEQKYRQSFSFRIKPMHYLNIEDQAIEDLCVLYNVHDNCKEKITVSRVQQMDPVSPIWRKIK